MDASRLVEERYQDICQRCEGSGRPSQLSDVDRAIWLIVSTRLEIDMEGFESVFEQLLTEEELFEMIAAFEALFEPGMADAFRRAHAALGRVGFYDRPGRMCHEFGPALEEVLAEIEAMFLSDPNLSDLDRKLAEWID